MKRDELLSRYLDGALSPEESARVEQDADARADLKAFERLQALSELPETCASFTAEDVLVRAGHARPRARWSWAAAAAAVFLLAVTHAAAFLFGAQRAEPPVASNPLDETERILREMATLDAAAPHDRLQRRLVDLRDELQERVPQLRSDDLPPAERSRAEQFATIAGQLEIAFEQVDDPGFRALTVRRLAHQALDGEIRFAVIPTNARSYERVTPLDGGRFRILIVRDGKLLRDEGTIEEIESRHEGLEIRIEGETK